MGASAESLLTVQQRCMHMRKHGDVVYLPKGIASAEIKKAFAYPGKVKTWECLLLAGPYGKYLMEGCFHVEVQDPLSLHVMRAGGTMLISL